MMTKRMLDNSQFSQWSLAENASYERFSIPIAVKCDSLWAFEWMTLQKSCTKPFGMRICIKIIIYLRRQPFDNDFPHNQLSHFHDPLRGGPSSPPFAFRFYYRILNIAPRLIVINLQSLYVSSTSPLNRSVDGQTPSVHVPLRIMCGEKNWPLQIQLPEYLTTDRFTELGVLWAKVEPIEGKRW